MNIKNIWMGLSILSITAFTIFMALGGLSSKVSTNSPTRDVRDTSSPSLTNGAVLVFESKGWSNVRVYAFKCNSNTHYVAVSSGGGVAIK